jgi:hypothetical protein
MPHSHCPECGCVLKKQTRSPKQHNFYFAVVGAAFMNWPTCHGFAPQDETHLRHWLQVHVGHDDKISQENNGDILTMADFAGKVLDRARETKSSGFIEIGADNTLLARFPKSINWQEVTQAQFQPIAQKVFDLIEAEIGVPVEQLVFETERAA